MSSRLGPLVVAALIAAAPAASLAEGRADAVDACIQAFLASDVAKDRKVTVQTGNYTMPRPLALSGLYQIEVVAKGRESGQQLARIVCQADAKGQIVAINGRPASAAKVAAR